MLQVKKKICKNCNTPQYLWSRGRCKICASIEDASPIKKVSDKKKASLPKSNELTPYFAYHISQIEKNPYCINCRGRIQASHFHVCHILPKAHFSSVKANLDNAVYMCTSILGGFGCHDEFDSSQNNKKYLEDFPALDKILTQFNKFKHLVIETGRKEFMVLEELSNELEIKKLTFLIATEKLTLQEAVDKYGDNLTKDELLKIRGIAEKPKDGIYNTKITVK